MSSPDKPGAQGSGHGPGQADHARAGSESRQIRARQRTLRFGAFEMHPVVFPASAAVVVALVASVAIAPGASEEAIGAIQRWIVSKFGWLYILSLSGFLALALWLGFGPYGRVRLGKDDERPEFSVLAWGAMLFSAGMGIGLVFWSVAEPIFHYTSPPVGKGEDLDAARTAMALTIFHWGLHPWALYAVVALALAYFSFRRGLPLSFRSLLHPLLGDRVNGPVGDIVDTLAVVGTLIGVATSLGLGAMQVNAGLHFLLGIPTGVGVQIGLIAGITALAAISVVLGLHSGIRRLSQANMLLAALLLIFVICAGGVLVFFNTLVDNIGAYLQRLPINSFSTGAYESEQGRSWLGSWTVFYWGWWIAWSPFVGMFIARISRGRTIREFIMGVLLLPTSVCIVWLTAFGSAALQQELRTGPPEQGRQYPVLETTARGLSIGESGKLIGPQGGIYERRSDGALIASDGAQVRIDDDGSIVTADGEPFTPSVRYDGPLRATERPLTAVQYLSLPVLNDSRTARVDAVPTALFVLLDAYPLVMVSAAIATLCIVLFFVTSSDSASLVIDMIASGGNPDPPVGTRLFWAISEGVVACALLVAGGLGALQTASIAAALPFSIVLILAAWSLVRALQTFESPIIPGDKPDA